MGFGYELAREEEEEEEDTYPAALICKREEDSAGELDSAPGTLPSANSNGGSQASKTAAANKYRFRKKSKVIMPKDTPNIGSAGAAAGAPCRPTSASAADTISAFFIDSRGLLRFPDGVRREHVSIMRIASTEARAGLLCRVRVRRPTLFCRPRTSASAAVLNSVQCRHLKKYGRANMTLALR